MQGAPVAEEHRHLPFPDDHLGPNAESAGAILRETMDQLVAHYIGIFDDIKNTGHCFVSWFLKRACALGGWGVQLRSVPLGLRSAPVRLNPPPYLVSPSSLPP